MHKAIADRVQQLRQWLTKQNYDAIIVPHEDEFLGEYIPAHNERLNWITGFAGSAGAAVITQDSAAMFVDGRYTVQVTKQVPSDIFSYHHFIQEPPITWLQQHMPGGSRLAIDPKMHSATWYQAAQNKLDGQIEMVDVESNPIDMLWSDRPQTVESPLRLMPLDIVGQSSQDKRNNIAQLITQQNADAALLTQIDSICWLLNIRGLDVPRLPAVLCHAILHADSSLELFINPERISADFEQHVGSGVHISPPSQLEASLNLLTDKNVIVDPASSNAWFSQVLENSHAHIIVASDPCLLPKAVKNKTESQGMVNCHVRDGVAMAKFLCWIDSEVEAGRLHDEDTLSNQLYDFRKQDESLADLSFDTISAAGSNAAMCHYNHADQVEFGKLELNSLYLVDSGGQYPDGTTDITRTVAIGEPSTFMKQQFTLVLKGHIALATARFPIGTTGSQLDILARQYLWAEGYNYDHGTGHGVGHFLSVHEGPQRISPAYNGVALQAGMVLSNEPGYYRANEFGIRIENLELVTKKQTQGDLSILGFESLTRCPIDVRAIDRSLLTTNEIEWLNQYHQKVWNDVGPLVDGKVKDWLKQATLAL